MPPTSRGQTVWCFAAQPLFDGRLFRMRISANQIEIELEDSGEPHLPAVLLIMGMGMQLISWPPGMLRALRQAGFRVIRFDNRDAGLSSHFDHAGVPNLLWQGFKTHFGLPSQPAYGVQDMARDALAVMDALHLPRAHVVGISMGGMIAQRLALLAPHRVASLCSIMSSSGAPDLPLPDAKVLQLLLGKPPRPGLAAAIDHTVAFLLSVSSPSFPPDVGLLKTLVTVSLERSYRPDGIARQMHAVMTDTERASLLRHITAPTLVIHGKADPLVPYACGEDTARRIPRARLVGVEGMGHDLPPPVVQSITDALIPFLHEHP